MLKRFIDLEMARDGVYKDIDRFWTTITGCLEEAFQRGQITEARMWLDRATARKKLDALRDQANTIIDNLIRQHAELHGSNLQQVKLQLEGFQNLGAVYDEEE